MCFAIAKVDLAHECHFAEQWHQFRSCETRCEMKKRDFAPKVLFRRVFRNCESGFGTRVPLRSTVTSISQLRNSLRSCCENGKLLRNWRFVAKRNLTPGLPFFLFIPVKSAAKRVSKIREPFSQPLHLLHQATPFAFPVVFSV